MMPGGGFGGLGGNGGLIGGMQRLMAPKPGAAPAVPADGSMQPTIGPGAAAPAAAPAAPQTGPVKFGLPQGGILGMLQGQSPQGLVGLLQRGMGGGAPLAGGMPQVGMLPSTAGQPGSPFQGPVNPQLPLNINPMNQF
jgi:hypothetical protein